MLWLKRKEKEEPFSCIVLFMSATYTCNNQSIFYCGMFSSGETFLLSWQISYAPCMYYEEWSKNDSYSVFKKAHNNRSKLGRFLIKLKKVSNHTCLLAIMSEALLLNSCHSPHALCNPYLSKCRCNFTRAKMTWREEYKYSIGRLSCDTCGCWLNQINMEDKRMRDTFWMMKSAMLRVECVVCDVTDPGLNLRFRRSGPLDTLPLKSLLLEGELGKRP